MKRDSSMKLKIESVMGELIGNEQSRKITDAAAAFDDPARDPVDFFESCRKVFSEFLGINIVDMKLQPIKKEFLSRKIPNR